MEWLQQLLDSGTTPLVTAFVLGLLTAISPCPLASNITAVGYICRDVGDRNRIFRNGILYTLGRIIAYAGLGALLIPLLRSGASIFAIQKMIGSYGGAVIGPALVVIGIFMFIGHRLNLPRLGFSGGDRAAKQGGWGALWLGILFSLAFCPSSGIFYFGMLIPLAASETGGYLLPALFAVATGLPVLAVAWILAYGVTGIGTFYQRMQVLQRWMNRIIAAVFIAVGIYYCVINFC